MPTPSAPTHRYRATVIPLTVDPADAELKADQGALPFVQFKAANSDCAALMANYITGRPVIRVERIEVTA